MITEHDIRQARSEGVQMGVELTLDEIDELLNVQGCDKYEAAKVAVQRIKYYINNKRKNNGND